MSPYSHTRQQLIYWHYFVYNYCIVLVYLRKKMLLMKRSNYECKLLSTNILLCLRQLIQNISRLQCYHEVRSTHRKLFILCQHLYKKTDFSIITFEKEKLFKIALIFICKMHAVCTNILQYKPCIAVTLEKACT